MDKRFAVYPWITPTSNQCSSPDDRISSLLQSTTFTHNLFCGAFHILIHSILITAKSPLSIHVNLYFCIWPLELKQSIQWVWTKQFKIPLQSLSCALSSYPDLYPFILYKGGGGWGGCFGPGGHASWHQCSVDQNHRANTYRQTSIHARMHNKARRVWVDLNTVNLTCMCLEGVRKPGKPTQAQGEKPREGPSSGLCAWLASNAVNMGQ